MIEMGLIVSIGMLILFVKLSWKNRMRLLSYPIIVDLCIFTGLTLLHWGTFSGVMVATVGAMFCSICLAIGRYLFGYMENNKHIHGKLNIEI